MPTKARRNAAKMPTYCHILNGSILAVARRSQGQLAKMLKVEVEKDRFYETRHDAKLSAGAVHGGRSAGMARAEGSVHRHSQHLLLSLTACASSESSLD